VYEEGPLSCIIVMHNFACVKYGHFEKCNTYSYGHYVFFKMPTSISYVFSHDTRGHLVGIRGKNIFKKFSGSALLE